MLQSVNGYSDGPYSEEDWFIFVCRNGCVQLAQDWFEGWVQCDCYYPVAKKYEYPKRHRSDIPVITNRPALGTYLFVRFYENIDWRFIQQQNSHVLQWLKIMRPHEDVRVPAIVRDEKIEELRRLEARGVFDDITPDQKDCALSKLLKGHPVDIPYGQFFGVQGATLDSIYRKIVKIKIQVLGKDVLLTFPFADIFPDFER
jgi:hypothetical protein